MISVRSRGRWKCSAASAVMVEVAMNSFLRQRAMLGAEPARSSIVDRN